MSDFLLCFRVEGYTPKLPSFKDKCHVCGSPVWRAHSSPSEFEAACIECGVPLIKSGDAVLEPTPKQIAEIRGYVLRKTHPG